ncbi:MAG: phage holin family protein [Sporichthyaceae bacterium]
MQAIMIRLGVNAAALWVAAAVVSGIQLNQGANADDSNAQKLLMLLIVAAIFAVVNTVVKPVVKLFSLPLFILTLGLIIFVINAAMLLLTSAISDALDVPFRVEDFSDALLGGLVISFISWLINVLLPDKLESR